MGNVTIALSYIWANYADAEKNQHFKNRSTEAEVQQAQLMEYHNTVLFGGKSDLISVSPNQSVIGRLKTLILKLIDLRFNLSILQNAVRLNKSGTIELNYEKFIFSGHSQGASHVTYLSKFVQLHRAILFSGPQDLISRDDEKGSIVSWLRGQFKTTSIYAFMHAEEEGTAELIQDNWRLMEPLGVAQKQHIHIGVQIYSSFSIVECGLPWCWGRDGIGKTERDAYYERSLADTDCTSRRCFYSKIPPAPTEKRASRPNHGSTVTDNLTPTSTAVDGTDAPIYADDIWEILLTADS